MRGVLMSVLLALAAAVAARGQDGEQIVRLALRVGLVAPDGAVVVDRGASDGVAVGDRVLLRPREGGEWPGSVVRVEERSATVELVDHGFAAAPGMRGEVLLPAERLARLEAERAARRPPPEPASEGAEAAPGGESERRWTNADEGFRLDMPLLSEVDAVRPELRTMRVTGRVSLSSQAGGSEGGYSDSFQRLGTELTLENPFGRGGTVHFDGELDYRTTHLPDDGDEGFSKLRVDRLSYSEGGTRFDARRWEVGRFLHADMPEFGLLDGLEWSQRGAGGDRWGASLGGLPTPDADLSSGRDLEVAAWYLWAADTTERFVLGGGYQKTFHDGDADRDLVVAKARWLPPQGWDLFATAWIDLYGSHDDAKDASIELTEAVVSSSRHWGDRGGMTVSYRHLAFPWTERELFTPVRANQLADDHYDRLALSGWKSIFGSSRLHAEVGGWVDEDESGGDVGGGLELSRLAAEDDRADLSLFGVRGRFSTVAGARATYGRSAAGGRWDVSYELANHRQDGFSNDFDDILQHVLRANQGWFWSSGWSLSGWAQLLLWDEQFSWRIGIFLERSF